MKKTKSKYEDQYLPADTVLIVNDDPDLKIIEVPLPKPPPLHEIDGYGLPAKEQKFRRPKLPDRVKDIDRDTKLSNENKYKKLFSDPIEYEEEIRWIQQQWERRINGYWVFINGKPTYIPGCLYFYCGFWTLDEGLPKYRDRDRKFFMFAEFVENDENCFGFIYPKFRREGATSKTACWNYEYISRNRRVNGGIQSMTEIHAESVFQKIIVPAWRKLPWFFKPVFEGSTNPKKELSFNAPAVKVTANNSGNDYVDSLESWLNFGSSEISVYDGSKLARYHGDEVGKTESVDIYRRHIVVARALSQGKKIVGKAIYTSTAGQIKKGKVTSSKMTGGKAFRKLCEKSDYHKRDKNGRTGTGLYMLFIPSYDGLDGFIDEYGNSMIEEAKTFLKNQVDQATLEEDWDTVSEIRRQFPLRYKDMFRTEGETENFNRQILEKRIAELEDWPAAVTTGNFEWVDPQTKLEVKWVPMKNGKFMASHLPPTELQNQFMFYEGIRIPLNVEKYSAGGDPYKFRETRSGKKSKGAGAVFWKRDFGEDPQGKDATEWKSHRFACTYLHRAKTKQEFGWDMVKMCVFFGCQMNTEINVSFLWDFFEEHGFAGYLYYYLDKKTGRFKKTPGANTGVADIEEIFREYQSYIEYHGHREHHIDILEQCLDIDDDMGDYDLFTAGGYALISANPRKGGIQQEIKSDSISLGEYFHELG